MFSKPRTYGHFSPMSAASTARPTSWAVLPIFLIALMMSVHSYAFPNVCSVIKTKEFNSCTDLSFGFCLCGFPPRPCTRISYYVPQTFVEVMPDPKSSFFGALPGAAIQLATVGGSPYGTEADIDTQTFHAHTINVPLAMIPYETLPCGGSRMDKFCFDGMSEHFGSQWQTGSADLLQPKFLAWSLSPKACIIKGAIESAKGSGSPPSFGGSPMCSYPNPLPMFPPSGHAACNGWGIFYPRSGVYNGPSQTMGALMVGSRLRSLSSEILKTTPTDSDEKWQMITPQSSSCFREGQNIGLLESIKNVREVGRLSGKKKGFLFVIWKKVSCCKDVAYIPAMPVLLEALKIACEGLG